MSSRFYIQRRTQTVDLVQDLSLGDDIFTLRLVLPKTCPIDKAGRIKASDATDQQLIDFWKSPEMRKAVSNG